MMSLSRVIKSSHFPSSDKEAKKITIKKLFQYETFQPLIGHETHGEEQQVIPMNQSDTEEAISQRLKESEEQANQLISEAKAEIKQMYDQLELDQVEAHNQQQLAYQEMQEQGYQEGLMNGRNDGFKEYASVIEEANSVIMSAKDEYYKIIERAEPVIVELAVELCHRMIGTQLKEEATTWNRLVQQVIKEVQEHEEVKIYVHPSWYERTRQQKEELQSLVTHTEELYIYADHGLSEYGCIIETKFGRIDATIDHQLNELKQQLLLRLEEVGHESQVTD
jgi:flagellar assembly protein FliH